MKNSLCFLALAAFAAIPFVGRAQVTYTNTDSSLGTVGLSVGVTGSLALTNPDTAIQTFSGFSNLSSVSWTLTDTVFGTPGTFNAYVAQWDVANSSIVGGTLASFGALNVPFNPGAGQTANLTFNGSWTAIDPSQTYALLLSITSGPFDSFVANVGTSPGGADAAFFGTGAAGYAATSSFTSGTFASDLATPGSGNFFDPGSAYTMSVTGTLATLAPVPEPKTAAAGIAALFVAALIGHRTWQRRKLASIPVVA